MVSTVSIIQADNCSTVPISKLDKISFVNISLISLARDIQSMTVRFECPKLVWMDGFSLWSVGFRPPNPDLANDETFYGIFL